MDAPSLPPSFFPWQPVIISFGPPTQRCPEPSPLLAGKLPKLTGPNAPPRHLLPVRLSFMVLAVFIQPYLLPFRLINFPRATAQENQSVQRRWGQPLCATQK